MSIATMTSRERVRTIVDRNETSSAPDRPGFWMGNPHADSWPALVREFGSADSSGHGVPAQLLSVRHRLGDDFRWICPEWTSYKHPEGKPIFDIGRQGHALSSPGAFADCESVQEVDDYHWPDPAYLDFTECLTELREAGPVYRASGFWAPFFHITADFYLEANRRFFALAGDLVDGFFFGNDFGTQLDLLISPDLFREFVFPYFRKLTDQGHEHGYQVILHSCGSIHKVIPDLISLGVDALHPLQAKAANMDADRLGAEFRGAVAFIGGIDTQDLLVNGSPADVEADVRRVVAALGPDLVVSPSHEALLPNVSPANVLAMARAVGAAE